MEEKEMEYVLCNTNFMNWVIKKLNEHYYIDDHDNKLDENDFAQSRKIKYLYKIISRYATNNNIYPTKSMQCNLYYVLYEGNMFFVYEGLNSYGCFNNTLNKKDVPYCINFEDVRKEMIEDIINSSDLFDGLKKEINKLYKKGISMDFINQVFNRLSCESYNEEKGYTYKKK